MYCLILQRHFYLVAFGFGRKAVPATGTNLGVKAVRRLRRRESAVDTDHLSNPF